MTGVSSIKAGYTFLFEKKKLPTGIVGSAILFILLVSVFSYSASSLKGEVMTLDEIKEKMQDSGGSTPFADLVPATGTFDQGGQSQENSEDTVTFTNDKEYLQNITFTLTWVDEPAQSPINGPFADVRYTNTPDSFGLLIEGPAGQKEEAGPSSNTPNVAGTLTTTIALDYKDENWEAGLGVWNITIICGECGDHEPSMNIINARTVNDNSNAWTLTVTFDYLVEPEEE